MSDVQWIKIVTEFFDDDKITLIESMPDADTLLIIWIKLLTLAGKKNMNGYIFLTENIPYTEEMLSTLFHRPLNTVRLALTLFKKYKMIHYNEDGVLQISNWEKHQNIEWMDMIREQTRLRVQKFRKKNKELPEPKEKKECNVTVTPSNAIDKIREDKKRVEKIRKEEKREDNKYSPEFTKTLEDFKIMRKKNRHIMTERAEELLIMKLDKLANNEAEQIEILEQSIMNSWQGVFPLRKGFNNSRSIKGKVKDDNFDYSGAMGEI